MVLPHLGQRALYCVACALRKTFWYAPAHLNQTMRNGRPPVDCSRASGLPWPRRNASSPATMSRGMRSGSRSCTRNQSADDALSDETWLRSLGTSEGAAGCSQLSREGPQIPPNFQTLRLQYLKRSGTCVMLVATTFGTGFSFGFQTGVLAGNVLTR